MLAVQQMPFICLRPLPQVRNLPHAIGTKGRRFVDVLVAASRQLLQARPVSDRQVVYIELRQWLSLWYIDSGRCLDRSTRVPPTERFTVSLTVQPSMIIMHGEHWRNVSGRSVGTSHNPTTRQHSFLHGSETVPQ